MLGGEGKSSVTSDKNMGLNHPTKLNTADFSDILLDLILLIA
jgi:hypothetical protein